jgi:hypothetical protein
MMMKKNKLGNYLALTLGAGAAATSAEGAITATHYTPTNQTNSLGISVQTFPADYATEALRGKAYVSSGAIGSTNMEFGIESVEGWFFVRSTSTTTQMSGNHGAAFVFFGGQVGDDNYALIRSGSFGSAGDLSYDVVGQFHFDSLTSGYLIALAQSDAADMTIASGVAAINGIPEPTSLALLGLGSVGLLARRRRQPLAA